MALQESSARPESWQKLAARIRILRLWAVFALAGAVMLSFLVAGTLGSHYKQFWVVLGVVLLIGSAVFPLNDAHDVESDRKSHPDRPLVTGMLTREEAMLQALFMLIVAVALSVFFLGKTGMLITLLCGEAVIFYSWIKTWSGLAGNVVTAILCSVVLNSGIITSPSPERFLLLILSGVLLSLLIFSREIVKDIADMKGDRHFGKRTLPLQYGVRWAYRLSSVSLVGTGVVVLLIGAVVLGPISFAAGILALTCFWLARGFWSAEEHEANHHARQLKVLLLSSLIAWTLWASASALT